MPVPPRGSDLPAGPRRGSHLPLWPRSLATEAAPRRSFPTQRVAQAVRDQVEGQDRQHDGDTGEDDRPGRGVDELKPFLQHAAPARNGGLFADSEKAQTGFGEQGKAEGESQLDDDRRCDVRYDMARQSRLDVAPRLLADSMYASSRTAMTSPRSNRTKLGTNTMAMAMAASLTSAPSSAATVKARISGGKEKRASIARMITESTAPRKNPAIKPSGMATTAAIPTISNAARNEIAHPK